MDLFLLAFDQGRAASGKLLAMSVSSLHVASKAGRDVVIPFALDPAVFAQNARDVLRLSGWAIHPQYPIKEVLLGRGEQVLARTRPNVERPGAQKTHQGLPGSERPGFTLRYAAPPAGDYWIAITNPGGELQKVFTLELYSSERQQLLFLHIAKCGGTSVNHFLGKHFDPAVALEHMESSESWVQDPASFERYEYLSGHVGLSSLDRLMNLSRFELVTVVREPFAQLRSHFAWIRRLADPGEEARYRAHPPFVQQFADKLARCDFKDPAAIRNLIDSLLHEERGLVDNYQTRCLSPLPVQGERLDEREYQAACMALPRFKQIGQANDLEAFFRNVARDMGWPPPEPMERRNVSSRFYGLEEPGDAVLEALEPLIFWDRKLYTRVEHRNARADNPVTG